MKEKVKQVRTLMLELGVTDDDLFVHKELPEITNKFPLEVYYSDCSRSFDVDYANKKKDRTAIGVIIDEKVYTFKEYWSEIEGIHRSISIKKFPCSRSRIGVAEATVLYQNLALYNKIADFFKQKSLGDEKDSNLILASPLNFLKKDVYAVFDLKLGISYFSYCQYDIRISTVYEKSCFNSEDELMWILYL